MFEVFDVVEKRVLYPRKYLVLDEYCVGVGLDHEIDLIAVIGIHLTFDGKIATHTFVGGIGLPHVHESIENQST